MWILLALISALATGVTATLTKVGMKDVDSNLAMALESVIILPLTWAVVLYQGHIGDVTHLDRKSLIYLGAAGVVTTIAYLCYFASMKLGGVAHAAPVDRLSLVFSIILAFFFLKEKVTPQLWIGGAVMAIGAILVATSKGGQ